MPRVSRSEAVSSAGSSVLTRQTPQQTVSPGNLLIAKMYHQDSGAAVLTDGSGGGIVWRTALAPTNTGSGVNYFSIQYAYNVSGTLTNLQVLATWGVPTAYSNLIVEEFSGFGSTDPLGNTASANGSSTLATTGTVTIPSSSVIVFIAEDDNGSGVFTSATYTVTANADNYFGDGYHVAASSEAASCTVTAGTWRIAAASFTQGSAPATPNTPSPANAATGAALAPTLTWTSAAAVLYDIYFGTTALPPLVSSGQAGASYSPGALVNSRQYFWKIVATNGIGSVTGPVWSFTTLAITATLPIYEVILQGDVSWTDISDDVVDSGVTATWGITSGNGPIDSVSGTGQCSLMMRNDLRPGKPIGYYSPNHAACRVGWTFGIPFRLRFNFGGTLYTRFRGKIYSILPDSGAANRRQVAVTAYDIIRDLAEAEVTAISIQINMTESQIIANILSSLPAASQPVATSIDAGVDTFPYALDTIGPSSKALSVIADIARSAFALVACKSDGTLVVQNRHTRSTSASLAAFASDFLDLQVPSDLSNVYNLVRVTSHPKTIDAAATTVLYALTGAIPSVSPGQTLTLFGSYNDPLNAQRLVGGTSMVTPLVAYPGANYDYAGNLAADGSGADQTADLSIAVTAFATTAKFVITNNGIETIYLVVPGGTTPMLRIRGKGVYDRGPQVYQASSTQPYGTRPIDVDFPYQGDPLVAQAAAEYIQSSYNNLQRQVKQMTFVANDSPSHMLTALTMEPGDRITVTEPVTGLVGVEAIVQSISLTVVEKFITVTFMLAPANVMRFWLWGIVERSEWGINTVYGF